MFTYAAILTGSLFSVSIFLSFFIFFFFYDRERTVKSKSPGNEVG